MSWQGPPAAQKLVVPQAGAGEPLLYERAVRGSDKIRDMGNTGERSRLEGDCYVLHRVSGHRVSQREVLESHWYSPTPLEVQSFMFIMVIKIICFMSSRNNEALVSSAVLPCDVIPKKVQAPVQAFSDMVFPSCRWILWHRVF